MNEPIGYLAARGRLECTFDLDRIIDHLMEEIMKKQKRKANESSSLLRLRHTEPLLVCQDSN